MSLTILPADAPREEWLAARQHGIGGSDVSAIVGMNPWKTALDVYCDKLGLAEPQAENRAMRLGKRLEPAILGEYTLETGRVAWLNSELYRHPRFEWALGTPDAFTSEPGVELKAHGLRQAVRFGEPGTDEIPEEHICQVSWYMALTGRESWDLAVLLGGQDFRVYHVARNPDLEAVLLEAAERFWKDHVLAEIPPALDGSESARRIVQERFPRNVAPLRGASPEESEWVRMLAKVRASAADLEILESKYETLLKASIGEAEGLEGEGFRVTWKATRPSKKTDWKGVVHQLPQSDELRQLVARNTTETAGVRRFLFTCDPEGETNHVS